MIAFKFCIVLFLLNAVSIVNGEVEQVLIKDNKYISILTESNKKKNETVIRNKNLKNAWFLNVPLLPIEVATSNSIPEGSCKKQLDMYLSHLNNGTLWATEMFDSSAKYPYGILEGLTRHLGTFDQCHRIDIQSHDKNGKMEEIRGRYCLVDIKYQKKYEPKNVTGNLDILFDPHGSAWEAIIDKGDKRRYERYLLQMALCVPATCFPDDIVAALKEPLEKFGTEYNLQVEVSINKELCHAAHEAPKMSYPTFVFCFIFLLIIVVVVISTVYDDEGENQSFRKELLFCFSARRNLKSIFRVNYNHRGLDSLHLLRFAFSTIVSSGHRQIQNLHVSNVTARYFEMTMASRAFAMILHNGTIIVDAFFGFGGLVLSYQFLDYLEHSSKNLNVFLLIIKRFVRLVPLYMFVTFAYAVVFYHLGSGPFWESRFGFDRDSCSNYWWTNLFLISNYYNGRNLCIFQSWYVAVDFQCFVIGLFLLLAFQKMSRKIGYTFLSIVLMISIAIPFYVTYKYEIDAFIVGLGQVRRFEDYTYFTDYYIKTHMRFPAYLVGLIMGIFIYDYKFATWRLSKAWSQFLIILLVIVLSIFTQHLAFYFVDPNLKLSLFVKALYASLHRPIFSFSICCVVLFLTIGDGLDLHYKFMTPRWVQPIAKLSYGYFLLHYLFQEYDVGTARTAFTFSFYNYIKLTVLDFVSTLVLALFIVILIEAPFKNLGLLLMSTKPIKESGTVKKIN